MLPQLLLLSALTSVLLLGLICGARALLAIILIENRSMTPTLEHGDRVLVARHWPGRWLRHGDIVLVWPWQLPRSGPQPFGVVPYVKRVVGLPGDTIVAEGGELSQFPADQTATTGANGEQSRWRVPPGHIFVCGDNRPVSVDSRSWGPIPNRSVLALVLLKMPQQALRSEHFATLAVGQKVPPFRAETVAGGSVSLANFAGHTTVFVFFAPCELCRRQLPSIIAQGDAAPRVGAECVLVSLADMAETRAFGVALGITIPTLVAPTATNPMSIDYGVRNWPFYCAIDEHGRVLASGYPGERDGGWVALVAHWERAAK